MRQHHHGIFRALARRAAAILIGGALSGCASLEFYAQAISGHLQIMHGRVPIARILATETTPADLRRKLELVGQARDFAARELRLPDHGSYRSYVDLGRPYVVWNVFATPELALEPRSSCFVFVGCMSYRSYFRETDAARHAAALRAAGDDVYVGGVAAYSTLGWFDDPVLNTMLRADDAWILELVFHELTHQRLYVRDDTAFNEGLATMVAEEGIDRWDRRHTRSGSAIRRARARDHEFLALILRYRDRLARVYAAGGPEAVTRGHKAAEFAALRQEYAQLRNRWGGYPGFDAWMSTDLNNAKLASVAAYHDRVSGFKAILAAVDGNFERFFAAAERLADLGRDTRERCLKSLAAGASPGRAGDCPRLIRGEAVEKSRASRGASGP